MAQTVRITHAGQTRETTLDDYQAVIEEMVTDFQVPWSARDGSKVEMVQTTDAPAAPVYSGFGAGQQVVDEVGKARVEANMARAAADGFKISRNDLWYPPGTRMAEIGYQNQEARKAARDEMRPAADTIREGAETIENEKRFDRVMDAGEFARKLSMNGKLAMDGFNVRAHAVRGLLNRIGSKAGSYIMALRERIAMTAKDDPQRALDKGQLLATLVRELETARDVQLNLRMRAGLGDVFAVTSPGYGVADFPLIAPDLLSVLPSDSKATMEYDEATTAWSIKVSTATLTPIDQQVVGEEVERGFNFRGADAGNSGLHGGLFALFLICLNASLHEARGADVSRTHRAHVLRGLRHMLRSMLQANDNLIHAWGEARQDVIPTDVKTDAGLLIPLESVIPGFFRHMLSAPRGELVGVLAGRKEVHAQALATTFASERRDTDQVTRADLGQALTRYVRDVPDLSARTDAQAAIGSWLVKREPILYQAR